MEEDHQKRVHDIEGEHALNKSNFVASTIIQFAIDTAKVYRKLIMKIKEGELSPEEAIKYLDAVETSLRGSDK